MRYFLMLWYLRYCAISNLKLPTLDVVLEYFQSNSVQHVFIVLKTRVESSSIMQSFRPDKFFQEGSPNHIKPWNVRYKISASMLIATSFFIEVCWFKMKLWNITPCFVTPLEQGWNNCAPLCSVLWIVCEVKSQKSRPDYFFWGCVSCHRCASWMRFTRVTPGPISVASPVLSLSIPHEPDRTFLQQNLWGTPPTWNHLPKVLMDSLYFVSQWSSNFPLFLQCDGTSSGEQMTSSLTYFSVKPDWGFPLWSRGTYSNVPAEFVPTNVKYINSIQFWGRLRFNRHLEGKNGVLPSGFISKAVHFLQILW